MAELRGEVMSGPARRRRWSAEEKAALLAEASRPGMSLSLVARRYVIARSVLLRWRRRQGESATRSGFVAVRVAPGPAPATMPAASSPRRAEREDAGSSAGLMEIALGSGLVVRFDRDVDVGVLARVVEALRP